MLPTQRGAFRLFQLFGITVFLHWTWFLLAFWRFQHRNEGIDVSDQYGAPIFFVGELLALFLIVLLHEFGHSLSCKQVGGRADQIILWPFGGIAFVRPPERPGAQLWSIAAGPLVNVVLWPILFGVRYWAQHSGMAETGPDTLRLLENIYTINKWLLIFNVLPIYPLDGGQILRSLLWYWLGRGKSLLVAAGIGFVGVAGLAYLAFQVESIYFGLITLFIGNQCLNGWRAGKAMLALEKAPRRREYACPACRQHPQAGDFWLCGRCQGAFDPFATGGACPQCQARYHETRCTQCGTWATLEDWRGQAARVI